MSIKFNPLVIEGIDISGGQSVVIGGAIVGSAGNSVLTTQAGGVLTEKILANGELLIGSTGNEPQVATISGTTDQVTVTAGPGSLTLSLPQDIAANSNPTFNNLTLTGDLEVSEITTTAGNLVLNPFANISASSSKITDLADPTADQDASTKKYVDDEIAAVYSNPSFGDDVFSIFDNLDGTKKITFQAANLTTGTTRTITMPDQNIDLGNILTAIQQDGSVSFTNNQSMNNNRLTNVANPVDNLDAANKSYVDSSLAGLDWQKDINALVANANTTAPGVGLPAAALGQRYILQSNTGTLNAAWGTITGVGDNDIVEYDGLTWAVAYDVSVQGPGALAWDRNNSVFVRWDGTSWDEFGGLSGVTAGAGLDKTGNTIFVELDTTPALEFDVPGDAGKLRVRVDNSTVERHSSGLRVRAAGITANELATNSVETVKILANAVTGAKIRLDNNEWLRARNAANSADLDVLRLNTSNNVEIGQNLLPNADASIDLGSFDRRWATITGSTIRTVVPGSPSFVLNLSQVINTNSDYLNPNGAYGLLGESRGVDGRDLIVATRNGSDFGSRSVIIQSGQAIDSATSGQLLLRTGSTVNGNSGNIELSVGAVSGTGTRGKVNILANTVDVNNTKIVNLLDPTLDQDAATKKYVDDSISGIPAVNEFSDSLFRIQDNGDSTKKIAFEASGITTATTRTITMPDADINLGNLANTNLSNLTSPTAINQNLLPDGDFTRDIGSSIAHWQNINALGVLNGGNSTLDLASYGDNGRIWLYSDMTATENGVAIQDWNATNAVSLLFYDGPVNNYVALKAPESLSASTTYTLPTAAGATGDVLSLGASNQLEWVSNNIIQRTVFTGAESASNQNVTGFLIPGSRDAFEALVLVKVDATTDLSQLVTIKGFKDGSNWILSESFHGDNSLVTFSMNSSGQLQYSSGSYAGFVSLTITFKISII